MMFLSFTGKSNFTAKKECSAFLEYPVSGTSDLLTNKINTDSPGTGDLKNPHMQSINLDTTNSCIIQQSIELQHDLS